MKEMIKRTIIMQVLLLAVCATTMAQSTWGQWSKWGEQPDKTFINPVLPSDYSDLDCIRVGNDYYAMSSTMQYSPGLTILHSVDLVNWEVIGNAVADLTQIGPELNWDKMDRYGRGVWAGSLRYNNGRFYIFFGTPEEGYFMTSAPKASGPWEPLTQLMAEPGWDDCTAIWDEQGQGYFLGTKFADNCKTYMFRMADDCRSIDRTSARLVNEGNHREANKLIRHGGYYYLVFSEHKNHLGRYVMAKRDKSLEGSFAEERQLLLPCREANEPNQGGIVEGPDGKWYFFTHHGTGDWSGRIASLLPVEWVDGWPLIGDRSRGEIGEMVWQMPMPKVVKKKLSIGRGGEFGSATLEPWWQWNYQPRESMYSLRERKGWMRLRAFKPLEKNTLLKAGNTLTQRTFRSGVNEVVVRMDVSGMTDGQRAGLAHYAYHSGAVGVVCEGETKYFEFRENDQCRSLASVDCRYVWLKTEWGLDGVATFAYSTDGKSYVSCGKHNLTWGYYRGDRIGIYCFNDKTESGYVDVDYMRYRMEKEPASNGEIRSETSAAVPFAPDEVRLDDSWVLEREQLNTDYLMRLDPERLLHNFRINAGLQSDARPLGGWEEPWCGLRGHFTGHYLSALSVLVGRYGDKAMTDRLAYMVDELAKCQRALGNSGYLSAFPERDIDHIETHFTGAWAPYYTINKIMQGLLDAYRYAGNKQAYGMVLRLADYVDGRMERMGEHRRVRMLQMLGANPQNEVGAMNEVLYGLYGVSRDPKHLRLAQMFEPKWMKNSMLKGEDVLSGLHANTHIVIVNGFAKAYEQTGDEDYKKATANFWQMLQENHAYANGSSSGPRPNKTTPTSLTAEHWGLPGQLAATLTNEIAESCVSHNTQKISSSLFAWTADAKYADAYMNTFYNSVMALHSAHTGRCTYHLPLGSPRRKQWLAEEDFRCCNGSSIEAFAALNNSLYFHSDDELWVNMYVPSTLDWKSQGLSIRQRGDFPFSNKATFNISVSSSASARGQKLNFFVPSWAKSVTVSVNGKTLKRKSAKGACYVSIKRNWRDGDKVDLVFECDFHLKAMPDDKNAIAVFYGPLMLAFDGGGEIVLKGTTEDVLKGLVRESDDNKSFSLSNAGRKLMLKPLMLIENEEYGVYATINNIYF